MFVELAASLLLAIGLSGLIDGDYPPLARPALILLGLICVVPIVQLIPIPMAYWRELPGHALPAEILRAADISRSAHSLSLTPQLTRLGALTLIVPAAIFIAALNIGPAGRDRILLILICFAFGSAVLGVFQVAAGGGLNLGIYRQVHDGYPIGFFANRNHEGDLLLIAIPACANCIHSTRWSLNVKRLAMTGAVSFFTFAVIATQSRTAAALLPISLSGAVFVWVKGVRDKRVWAVTAGMAIVFIASCIVIEWTPAGQQLAQRFGSIGEDLRPRIWQGSWEAAKNFWPIGSGIGSFVSSYQMFEDLDSVNDLWVNHAHNDYLEIVLETGAAGAILIAAYGIMLSRELFRTPSEHGIRQRYTAIAIILILLIHSINDYPLRTFFLLSIFGFSNGMIFELPEKRRRHKRGPLAAEPQPVFAAESLTATERPPV
jgi:O-antigen ligase